MTVPWLWALLACGPRPIGADPAAPVELRVTLGGAPRAGGGVLVVQAAYDPTGELVMPEPVSEGLTFEPDGPPTTERIGDRDVVTRRYVYKGPKGSYEIPPLVATWRGEGDAESEASSVALFVDLDVPPPREGELEDIVEPDPVVRIPWVPILAVATLFAGGLFFAFRPRRRAEAPPEPPDPPDVACLKAWDAVRLDPALPIEDKAKELARLFRLYVEAVLGFEATSRTTSELLEKLGTMAHLPQGNLPRARRVLRATDRVKFAEERPVGEWLAELDADLRAFVESTRPSAWRAPPADPPAAPPADPPAAAPAPGSVIPPGQPTMIGTDPFAGDTALADLTFAALDHGCDSVEHASAGPLIPFFLAVDGAGQRTLTRVMGGVDYAKDVADARTLARKAGRPWAMAYDGFVTLPGEPRIDAIYVEAVGAATGAPRLTFAQRYRRGPDGKLLRVGNPALLRAEVEP